MTAASNPAAELTERGEHFPTTPVQCFCGWRETDPDAGTWTDHLLAAGGAATDEGLRARVEEVAWSPSLPSCGVASRDYDGCFVHEVLLRLRAALDAAPAPTEDATACTACDNCYGLSIGPDMDGEPCPWCRVCGCHEANHPAASRAADTAAEELRTEAQIKSLDGPPWIDYPRGDL